MITRELFIFILLFITTVSNAQTKVIAHKSHSGNKTTFSKAYQKSLFDNKNSNFGQAPEVDVKNAQLDSLIFVNDTMQIMVTREFCSNVRGENAITEEKVWNSKTKKAEKVKALDVSEDRKTSLWKAGRDTVYNHELFSHNASLEWIKKRIKTDYYFANSIDSTVFIGYSNDSPYEEVNPFIKVNNTYTYSQNNNITLDISVNGVFSCDCSKGTKSGLDIIWGVEFMNSEKEEWQTVLPFGRKTKPCGLPYDKYIDERVRINMFTYLKRFNNALTEVPKGKYKLFAKLQKTKEIMYSNEFEIK